ncbi:MAG: hypothetical protein KJS90_01325 [Acidobacteria bacterium]|nr:hypothetical protein [Acidobacteriota bacterium]
MTDFRAGRIPPAEARRRVLTLIARDDNGLEWSIDPDTGGWQYRNQFGEMTSANPPAYGVAGFTPADLGGGRGDDPRVRLYEVDQDALRSAGQLRGSTSITENTVGHRPSVRGVRRSALIGLIVLLVGALLVVTLLGAL